MRFKGLQVYPAFGGGRCLHVQAHQLAHAQATAIQQLGNRCIARFQPGVVAITVVAGQLHGIVYGQCLG